MRNLSLAAVILFGLSNASCSSKKSSSSPAASPSPPASPPASAGPTPENATALAFTSAALNQPAGACGTVTLQSNSGSTATPLLNAHSLNLTTSAATGRFFSDGACTAAVASIALGTGVSAGTFYYADTAAGSPTLTASDTYAPPLAAATQTATITAAAVTTPTTGSVATTAAAGTGPASILAFTNAPLGQSISGCGSLTVAVQDGNSNNIPVTTPLDILLTSSSTTGRFFVDSACAESTIVVAIGTGTATTTLFYNDTTVGSPAVTATPPASAKLTAASQTETIEGALQFGSANYEATAASCVQFSVTVPVAQSVDLAVTLATSTASGTFYADAGCTAAITSYNIGSGDTIFNFSYREPNRTNDTLTVTPPAAAGLAPAVTTVSFVPTL